jgi:hypothetical protein
MKKTEQKSIIRATIYNVPVKTKTELRAESDAQLQAFLKKGGIVQVDEKKRKSPKTKMSGKSSRGFMGGSSGFATGYPSKTFI